MIPDTDNAHSGGIWAVHMVVSRPTTLSQWGTLPGAYVVSPGPGLRNRHDASG